MAVRFFHWEQELKCICNSDHVHTTRDEWLGSMTSPLIHIHHATVYRGTQPVLDDISLVIARGCSTVILGPNGSGKTTLMKIFSRELYPVNRSDGFVRLIGQEMWNVWELRTQIGMVSPDVQQVYQARTLGIEVVLSGFFSSMDIYDHQAVSAVQRTRSLEMMPRLGIAHLWDRLSGKCRPESRDGLFWGGFGSQSS